jgi:Ca-activated chloride channel homolog
MDGSSLKEGERMAKRIFSALIILIIFLLMPQAIFPQRQTDEIIRLSTELVVLDVLALNKKTGKTVSNLKKEDFELYENNIRQEITHFSRDKLALSIILLLDVSPSVWPVMSKIRDGALDSLALLKPEDEVAVMAFAGETSVIETFTKSRGLIVSTIGKLGERTAEMNYGTKITQAISEASLFMRKASNPSSRRAIIVITDNIGFFSKQSEKETMKDLLETGTVVCGMIVAGTPGSAGAQVTSPMELRRPSILPSLKVLQERVDPYAERTGGEILYAENEQVRSRLTELIEHLRSRYSIGYISSNTKFDGKFRRIKLRLTSSSAKRYDQLALRTRQGYYSPNAE